MKMYELTDAYVSLMAQYEDAETDAEREQIAQAILDTGNDIAEKAENYARLMKNAEADVKMLSEEIDRLTAKKKRAENLVKRVKEYLLFAMGIAGATEIKTSIGKWRVQKNPPSVKVLDEMLIPARFFIEQAPKIDKTAILAEFRQTGEVFDGVEITQGESVRFR